MKTIDLQTFHSPHGIEWFSHDSRLFVANSNADHIAVIDTESWHVIDRYTTGDMPDGIAYFSIKKSFAAICILTC